MSIQISVDPAGLSQEQREAVADFILAFPGKACAGTCGHAVAEIHAHTAGVVEGPTTAPVVPAVNELEALQHDHESTMPEAVFGKPDTGAQEAAAAFGGATPAIAAASTVAPPPPVNTAPITTTPGVASSAAGASSVGVELDKHGLPWDGRIHAESKGKIVDGSWRKKRQVDPALVAQVEAELRQVMGAAPLAQGVAPAPTPVSVAASTIAQSVPTGAVPLPVAPPPAPAPVAGAVPLPVAPPPAPAPVAGAAPTMPAAPNVAPAGEVPQDARQQFVGLVGRASAAIQAGKVSQAEVKQICADSGIPALPLLANRLDLVATVASRIDALIAARGQ